MDLINKAADLIKPAKATIAVVGSNAAADKLECMFNPTEYRLSQKTEVDWLATPRPHWEDEGLYLTTSALTLTMQLLFDDFASGKGDVTPYIDKLLKWQKPTTESGDRPHPPLLTFAWGKQLKNFKGVLTKVEVAYKMFRRDGTPIQAEVDITLEGQGETVYFPGTNPTSHAIDSRRIRTLVAGESLQSIAYDELGKATYWRALAELNGIDDPLRVEPGRTLLIPTVADAARSAERVG